MSLISFRNFLSCPKTLLSLEIISRKASFRSDPTNLKERVHLIDNSLIDFMVKAISSDIKNEKATIIEINPGPGYLVDALLKAGAPRVVGLIETSCPYRSTLERIRQTYPESFKVTEVDILFVDKKSKVPKLSEDFLKSILNLPSNHPGLAWTDDPPIKVIASLTRSFEKPFLRRLFKEFVFVSGFFSIGRPHFYFFLSGYEASSIIPSKRNKRQHFSKHFCDLFFDVNLLGKFSWSNFHPQPKISKKNARKDVENAYLISFLPKEDLTQILPMEDWPDFFNFLMFCYRRRDSVVAFMEAMIPDCGPQLLKMGISVFQPFQNLDSMTLLKIFLEMRKWPQYKYSSFSAIQESGTGGDLEDGLFE